MANLEVMQRIVFLSGISLRWYVFQIAWLRVWAWLKFFVLYRRK